MMYNTDEKIAFNTISVIGLGYIGLPTAAVLAARKIQVIGVDVNQQTIDTINRGEIHIKEPELDIVVHAVVSEGYLRATKQPEPADAFLIAVPTPFKEEHQPDLSYVKVASESIAPVLKKGDLIILESTSPVGTTEKMATWIAAVRPDLTFPQTHQEQSDIRIAYCPERVMPGHVLHELVQNDRIIGGMTPRCSQQAVQLYKIFVEGQCLTTNTRTAEMCKLTENSFRDVNIAFANELSMICDKLDINVWELIRLANHHPRVEILKPGPGVGGHCIAVDPWFIVSQTPEQAHLIKTARDVNDAKPLWVIKKVKIAVAELLKSVEHSFSKDNPAEMAKNITIACLGLTFKANIDDLRESPALEITRRIAEMHPGRVMVIEPNVKILPADLVTQNVEFCNLEQALVNADIIVKLVDHTQFPDIGKLASRQQIIIDICSEDSLLVSDYLVAESNIVEHCGIS